MMTGYLLELEQDAGTTTMTTNGLSSTQVLSNKVTD